MGLPSWARRGRRRFTAWIERQNVEYCNPALNGETIRSRLRSPIANGLAHLGLFIMRELRSPRGKSPHGALLAFAGSYNHYKSFDLAFSGRDDALLVRYHNFAEQGFPRIGLLFVYLTGALWLPLMPLLLLMIDRPVVRKFALTRLDQFLLTFGSRFFVRRYVRRSGAKAVLLFSNLQIYNTILVESARRVGVRTVFATHAPVGRAQRALETDFALLDGEWQHRIYPPSRTQIIVTGSARGAALVEQGRDRDAASGLIVATNPLMRDLGDVERFVDKLRRRYPHMAIGLRPHPADFSRHEAHRDLCARRAMTFSDPKTPVAQAPADFKYVASALSGVLVDAALTGLYPLVLRSAALDAVISKLPEDYYGLFELGLARPLDMDNPRLPENWIIGAEREQLELASRPGHDARAAQNAAIDRILNGSR